MLVSPFINYFPSDESNVAFPKLLISFFVPYTCDIIFSDIIQIHRVGSASPFCYKVYCNPLSVIFFFTSAVDWHSAESALSFEL